MCNRMLNCLSPDREAAHASFGAGRFACPSSKGRPCDRRGSLGSTERGLPEGTFGAGVAVGGTSRGEASSCS